MMYEILDQLRTFEPPVLYHFKNIEDFMERIEVKVLATVARRSGNEQFC